MKDLVPEGSVFDTHCHLEFLQKRNAAIRSLSDCMKRDGEELGDRFRGCIVNFCHPSYWSGGETGEEVSQLLRDSARDVKVGISIGCHPHFVRMMSPARWRQLRNLLSAPSHQFPGLEVVAFGECGLDYSRNNNVDKELQMEVFEQQLKLAMDFSLPLILHLRDAEEDGLAVLDRAGVPPDYPIHR